MSQSDSVRRVLARVRRRVSWGVPLLRAAAVCTVLFACTADAFASPPATTTALAISSNGSPVSTLIQGNLVTLTAAVTSGSTPLTVGQVEFCDAAWPHCTDVHQLALAQLTSAGTATFRFVPRAGTLQYKAIFLGTNNYASSTSSVQDLTVTSSAFKYLSSTTLAFSGSPGDYTLTATVTGGGDPAAPSGMVSFLDTNNANYVLGTATLAPVISQLSFADSANLLPEGVPAVGDFNGDGIPDLAITNNPFAGAAVTIQLGNGDGTFTQGQTLPVPNIESPDGSYVADFNGDGIADLLMFESQGNPPNETYWVQVALGNGDGTFTLLPPMVLPAVAAGLVGGNIAIGDFNGDGKTDLIIPYQVEASTLNSAAVYLWFVPGNGDGTFGQPTVGYQANNPGFGFCSLNMLAADFNGDGNLDLACPNGPAEIGSTPQTVSVLLGNGHGSFNFGSTVAVGAGLSSIAVADFNGDGKADLAAVSFYYPVPTTPFTAVFVALGNGDGTFAPTVTLPVTDFGQDGIVAGDFNGDGFPDIAVTYSDNQYGNGAGPANILALYLGDGNGNFSENDVLLPLNSTTGPYVATGDFNRDGRSDLAMPEGKLSVFLSEPASATATVTGISPVGTGIHLVDASYPGLATVLAPSLSNTVGLEAEPVATTLTLIAAPTTGVYTQPFTLAATLSPTTAQNHTAGGTVTFYNGGVSLGTGALANGVATLTVSTVLPVGTYNLTATYSGDTNFAGSTASLGYLISASPSAITFIVPNQTLGNPPFAVAATSASPGAFTYSVVSGPATISGSTVTLTGVGTVILQASQAASGIYAAATQNAIFTVAKGTQTISFAAPASPVSFGAAPIALSASASSGLAVAFSVLSGPATLSGSTVTITGIGTVVVAANQSGNANYLAAAQVTQTIVMLKGAPLVTMAASQNPVLVENPVTLTATVSSSAATPTGSITFSDGATVLGTATLNSGTAGITVSTLALGANPILAAYSGDGNYNPATGPSLNEAVQDFTLIVSGNPAQTIQYGGTASYTLAVASVDGSNLPSAVSFAVSGEPNGSTIGFSPATLPAGSGASTVALTIQVPNLIATTKDLRRGVCTLTALALCGLVLPFRRRLKLCGKFAGWMGCIVLLLAAAGGSAALTGCGPNIITPRVQSFTVTVTATSGALSHAASAGLVVQ